MQTQYTTNTLSQSSILARNKVLRQTYILLGLNVLFSAFCAFVGMKLGMVRIPAFITLLVMFGAVAGISANRNNGLGIILLFAFTGFLGLYMSNILNIYSSYGMNDVVVKALIGTGVIFFSLSAYVLFTGVNFTFLGGFLFTGAMVVMLAMLGAMVFNMTALSVACSAGFLVIFSGYVLYHTSNIIHGEETNYITATLDLFMSIFNIFVSLLNLLSIGRN